LALAELPFTVATIYLGAGLVEARSGRVLAIGLLTIALSVGAFYLMRGRMRAAASATQGTPVSSA
jgi:hypothetical protein